jgi:hypothetical protein
MADERTADDSTRDDAKGCACGKGLGGAVTKAAHQDRNTGRAEPAVPTGKPLELPTTLSADIAHLVPPGVRDGAEALQAVRAILAARAGGGGAGTGGGGEALGPDLTTTYRGTGGPPSQYVNSPGLAAYDAGRGGGYVPQRNSSRGGRR